MSGKDSDKTEETTEPRETGPEQEGAGYEKADILERILAKFIDLLVVGAFFVFPTIVGPVAGITYLLISDGLKKGQGLGKKVIGLKVVSLVGEPGACDFKQSILRNLIFALLIAAYLVLGLIPYVGKLVVALLAAAVVVTEVVRMHNDDRGLRLGDSVAETMVVETEPSDICS